MSKTFKQWISQNFTAKSSNELSHTSLSDGKYFVPYDNTILLEFYTKYNEALKTARDEKISVMTHPSDLTDNSTEILLFTPIYKKDEFKGYILGVLPLKSLFTSTFSEPVAQNYLIRLLDADKPVAQFPEEINKDFENSRIEATENFETYGIEWNMGYKPTLAC